MAGIKDYSTTNLNNTSLNGISVAEGMLPSNLNNAIRALMVNTRSWYNDSQWVEYGDGDGAYTAAYASATSFTIAGVDVTPIYHEGRRIKLTAITPGTIYGTISSSSFSTDTTINVTWDSGSLSNEAISNVYIGALSKTNNSLPTGVIATATLADGSVTTIKIADSAVTTAKINDAAVTNAKLGADSVNGSKIADDSINSEHYVDGSIDTAHIADSQITTAKIADSNVTNAKLATDSVTTAKITNLNVTSGKIADASIANSKIGSDAVDGTKIADDSINSEHYADGSIDTQHIADSQITTAKIADSNVTTSKIADSNITTSKINNDAVTADKIADAVIVTNAEASGHTPNDTTFFTTSASDGRYFRQDSSETISSGDTWSDSDSFIATTAAIDDRIIDLVDDVGGFFPIADETNFPNTNPDVNDGAGTIVSIKEMATTRTPSGGTVTISGGTVGGSTVTITGCGSTVLTAGFGVLVETTTTLNTYTFHRLVPKATEVTTVAAISSDITTVAGDTTDIGVVSGLSSDIQSLADIEDGTVATNAISNVGNNISSVVTTASNISGVNSFADRYRVSATAPTTSLDSGDLYFDTSTNILNVYGASGWQNAGSSVNGTSQRYNYTATSGQTTFTGSDNNGNTLAYDAGYIDVYLNGVKLLNGTDVTVTSGSSVVLASGATTGDVVDIVAYGTFSVASLNADNLDSGTVPSARLSGAYTGITNLTMSGTLTVGDGHTIGNDGTFDNLLIQSSTGENIEYNSGLGSHIFKQNGAEAFRIDDTTGNVGIGTSNPLNELDVNGSIRISLDGGVLGNGDEKIKFDATGQTLQFQTADTERMRITSDGSIGIGTSSPSEILHIEGNSPYLVISNTGENVGGIKMYDSGGASTQYFNLTYDSGASNEVSFDTGASGEYTFNVNTAEKMRIDSSGNLLVGRTNALPHTASAGTSADNGQALTNTGYVAFGRFCSSANDNLLLLNRTSTDGNLISFRKDGTEVGSIKARSSFTVLQVGSLGTGISGTSTHTILPSVSNARSDNTNDLGNVSYRWKDIYLSGGAYLGGTGTANKLDDYEEGTWTATLSYGGGQTATLSENGGVYTKVGRMVTVHMEIDVSNTNSGSGNITIGGLPFTVADLLSPTGNEATGPVGFYTGFSTAVNSLTVNANQSSTNLVLQGLTSSTSTLSTVLGASQMGTGEFRASITYFTT